ncbi:MAG: putative cyclohydrolase 1 type 2 [Firmicutes bacterium]|nr:putative cyclohydrolase 1 type 2 [Bacillota bacterium]
MPVKCGMIIKAMEAMAPINLAESWDNPGLIVGSPAQEIKKVLVALDVTPEVASRAAVEGIDMIVAHHPLIFNAIKKVRTDSTVGKTLAILLKNDIAVYAAHTNLDSAAGGINDLLADRLGLADCRPLEANDADKLVKLAVFVPEGHIETVRSAITKAGAGHIGKYSHCTFQVSGLGTFLPLAGTQPFIGEQGKLERVPEMRLETIVPATILPQVVAEMVAAHPYEEVAYDVYPLANSYSSQGLGRIGRIMEPMALNDFSQMIKTALKVEFVKVVGNGDRKVQVVAVCGGAGSDFVARAIELGADVLVTGDVKYDAALEALDLGLAVIDAGHFATERLMVNAVSTYLQECSARNSWLIDVKADNRDKDVFYIV